MPPVTTARKKTGEGSTKEPDGASDLESRLADAYATEGAAIELGRAVKGDAVLTEAVIQIPLAMTNRHGLIAGATGTGKTVTVQVLAEQLAEAGVAVFAADMKGDLSGIAEPGASNEKIAERSEALGVDWKPKGQDVTFWSLGGLGRGIPLRASVTSFGADLLAKVLGSNDTQRSSLALVFAYAEKRKLALLDLADLRALLQYLTGDAGKDDLAELGGVSSQTAGVLLRSITELEQQGADAFFGVPEIDIEHIVEGRLQLLELPAVQDRPKLFSTFLMWLLAELFEKLPEVGDLDQPKLVFFFDEAHLLFTDASKAFVEQVAQTVRLIRSKGIGVFFITQLPDDVPSDVLAQLGNRIQHALRAHTPRDAKALRAAVTTYPKTDDYDLEEDITSLGTGEAMVTILDAKGTPTPVAWTKMVAPASKIGDIGTESIEKAAKDSSLWGEYAERKDEPSAADELQDDLKQKPTDEGGSTGGRSRGRSRSRSRSRSSQQEDGGVIGDVLGSREGRSMINKILGFILDLFRRRR